MSYLNTSGGGTNIASVDVCNTPSASGVTPITYVNTSQCAAATNFSTKVYADNMPAHHLGTSVSVSSGDEAGVSGGVVSGTFIQSTRWTAGSAVVMIQGQPATKLTSATIQNSTNGTGTTTSPSQTIVVINK